MPSPELEQRYPGWRLTSFFQNLPAVADFRDVGEAAGAFYEQATGRSVDGVIGK